MWEKCFDTKKISLAEKNQTQTHEDGSSLDNPVSDTRRNGQPPKSQLTKKSTCQKVNLSIK